MGAFIKSAENNCTYASNFVGKLNLVSTIKVAAGLFGFFFRKRWERGPEQNLLGKYTKITQIILGKDFVKPLRRIWRLS